MTRTRSVPVCAALYALVVTTAPSPAAEPEKVRGANYPLAQKFTRDFVSRNVQEANVFPQWVGKTDVFWYQARTPAGIAYWRVDPAKKTKEPLFDAGKLASALSEVTKKPLEAGTLALGRVSVTDDGKKLKFAFDEYQYEYDLAATTLTKGAKVERNGFQPSPEMLARMTEEQRQQFEQMRDRGQQQQEQQQQQQQDQQQQQQGNQTQPPPAAPTGYKAVSPDKKKYVYAYKHNLYLADEGAEDKAVQLSKDGEEEYSFGSSRGGFGGFGREQRQVGADATTGTARPAAEERKSRPSVTWSPDSKAFYVSRSDGRGVQDLFLVDSLAQPRPKLETYKYPMPGEEKVRKQELFYCDAAKGTLVPVKAKWKDERYSGVNWGKTPGELRFIRRDRLQRNLAICSIDIATGTEKSLLAESFDSAFLDSQPVRYIEETDELLWWSERSGWGHFYLYGRDGTVKNAITAGAWRASRIVEVDGKNKQLYFVGNAREPGENLYFNHLYRVRFDGTGLTLLDPSTAEFAPVKGGLNHTSYLSPSKKYVVTTASATDHEPISLVYDELGKPVMTLETTDLTQLKATGWKLPETFVVKAADGVTDLYGNMWKPFDFDPKKSYPIIANVYPGPQMEGTTHKFAAHGVNMQMAQLGFVVIQVGHRGGSPERSKAYHTFGYYNLRDYGLVDKKAAIEQLAARHAYIDLDRVGIYGHSGGGFMSAAAVLQPPYNDFFKVAVASAGNHDNNIYNDNWSERYHGMKEVVAAEEKKDAATGTTTSGGRTGQGGQSRRRPPEEEAIEAEIEALLTGFDPDDKQSLEEVEKKLADLQKKLAEAKKQAADEAARKDAAKKAEDKKTDDKKATDTVKKDETKKVEDKKTADTVKKDETKTEEKKAEEKAAPKTKFEIKVPTNAELAANLKGHLLLVHGEIDNNVHPANTMRLADALIKANKRFDLLIIPGARHAFGPAQPYFTQKMWDFFAEHLLGDRQTKADIYEKDVKRR